MSFDGVVTRAVTHELEQTLTPGRIMKIYQPTQTELVFTVRSGGKNHSLLISAHPSYARMHITDMSFQNPKEPPMFCMLLRKHLVGGFIESIEQEEMERIIRINVRGKDEIGDEKTKTLVVEIMGKHSNILLVDQEREMILDSIKHISPAQNRHRTLLPGHSYVLPPGQGKTNPLKLDSEQFVKKLDFNAGKMDKQIMGILMGFSPMIATEIAYRARLGSSEKYKQVFEDVQSTLLNHEYTPLIIRDPKEIFYVVPLQSKGTEPETFETVSAMLDAYYSGKAERDRVKQQAGDLARFMKNEKEKNERKIKKHHETLKKAEQADQYQRFGELLTAHMHLVKPGAESVTVVDYYDPEQSELTIELNPNKSPSENAQGYFQTYQKMKKSGEVVLQEKIFLVLTLSSAAANRVRIPF